MDTVDLKEYLGIVVDMEKNIYLQDSMISKMQGKYDELGKPKSFEKPVPPEEHQRMFGPIVLICSIPVILGLLLLRWGLKAMDSTFSYFLLGVFATLIGGVFVCGAIVSLFTLIKEEAEDSDVAQHRQAVYAEASREYERNMRDDHRRIRQELTEKAVLTENLKGLKAQNLKSKQSLEKIYSKNIIYPKYRNLIMVCSLYEYICAGRCTTLEGHEGAYNILEMEIRLDRVITQLDQVIAKLGAIQANQFMLYSAIQESNRQSAQILESTQRMANQLQNIGSHMEIQSAEFQAQLADLQKSSALAAYQAERTQKELHYMNRMNYLSGKYDDVFFNLPPT